MPRASNIGMSAALFASALACAAAGPGQARRRSAARRALPGGRRLRRASGAAH
jgi:hypothetical protein